MTSKINNEDCLNQTSEYATKVKKIDFTLTNENAITLINFYKIFKDLLMDFITFLLHSF